MKQIVLLIVGLFVLCSVNAVLGEKVNEPNYGHGQVLIGSGQIFHIIAHEGDNVTLNITDLVTVNYRWTFTSTFYTGNSSNDAWFNAWGDNSGYVTTERNEWFTSPVDQVIKCTLYMSNPAGSVTLKVTIKHLSSTDYTARFDAIDKALKNINSTITIINTKIQGINNSVINIQNQINNLNNNMNSNTVNITTLKSSIVNIQSQIDSLKSEIAKVNASITTNINITQMANLTAINKSIEDLTKNLNSLKTTVSNLHLPPDTQANITKLQWDTEVLSKGLTALQNKVNSISGGTTVKNNTIYNNNTIYSNNTINKTKMENGNSGVIAGAIVGGGIGGVAGAIGGLVAGSRGKKKKEEPDIPEEPMVAKATVVEKPSEKPDEGLDEIMGRLEGPKNRAELKDKSVGGEVDEVPIVPKTEKTISHKITIGKAEYTEAQIMSKLSSLPRGLPPGLSDMEPEELASELMTKTYSKNSEGDIIFLHEGRIYYGDPAKPSIYMQKAKE